MKLTHILTNTSTSPYLPLTTKSAGQSFRSKVEKPSGQRSLFRLLATGMVLFLGASLTLSGQTISTVAGDGSQGNTGDGGQATSATLTYPEGVAVDGSGNYYIISENIIRKVNGSTGVISTYAGGGTNYSDGIAATSAQLQSPGGIALDSSGNLYIADTGTSRVRKVIASTGVITTVAGTLFTPGYSGDGGAATSAELHTPYGVAIDSSGNVYIGDLLNYRVRKVTASTGIISTYAGNGYIYGPIGDGGAATSAEVYKPIALAVDGSSNVYISDNLLERIRAVTASSGDINTVAGNGTAGYSGDGGAATSAEIYNPLGIALDSSGNLYIADSQNSVVRIVSSGTINTFAGNGTAGYSGDGGAPTSAELNAPTGVAAASSGNVLISDSANQVIRKVTP